MMMPTLKNNAHPKSHETVQFLGMSNRYPVTAGTLYDADGLGNAQFPSLSPLPAETEVRTYDEPVRIFAHNGGMLCITETKLLWNDSPIADLSTYTDSIIQPEDYLVAGINAQIVIFPLKIAINTTDNSIRKLDRDEKYANVSVSINEFVTQSGQYFDLLRGCSTQFAVNDTVAISDASGNVLYSAATIRYINGDTIGFYANTLTKINGTNNNITLSRTAPKLSTLCESNNRLWGTDGNTIYACALGDPLNWNRYDGLSDDSYAVTVASDGAFTAAAHYGTHVCFFKENCIHKLYGSKPSNYQVVTVIAPGVKSGCARSIATIGSVLYFCGAGGIYAYDGDTPSCISSNIDDTHIAFAVGTAQQYIAYTGERTIAFDTVRKLWYPQSHDWLCDMAYTGGVVFLLHPAGELCRRDADIDNAKPREWWVQLADMDDTASNQKRLQKLVIQADVQRQGYLRIDVRTDDGQWHEVYAVEGTHNKVMNIPVYPNRCLSMGIRFRAYGNVTIRSIDRIYTSYETRE